MQKLNIEKLALLVRIGSVDCIRLVPWDDRGWVLKVDHSDPKLTANLHSQRNGLRVFRTADAAIKVVQEVAFFGSVSVVMPS